MKMLKTIHFDQTDGNVYELPAGTDEWAISGAFSFSRLEEDEIKGKLKQAFSNGFLSLENFGRATFATVAEIEAEQKTELTEKLAQHFHESYGAPSINVALPVAGHEIEYIQSLCEEHPINTVFTVRRFFDDKGDMREEFRTVTPPSEPIHTKIWEIVEDE